MGIYSNRSRDLQRRSSTQPQCEHINGNIESSINGRSRNCNGSSNKFLRCFGFKQHGELHNHQSRTRISIHPILFWTRYDQPNNHTKSNRNNKRHRHNKHVYAISTLVLSLVSPTAALAESVGGVSATANPIANSSGSVTNQAIQVLQGPYVTNTYGGGVSCQGTTLNMTPYIQFAQTQKDPWEDFYNEPQYDMRDFTGRTTQQTVTVKNYPWEPWYDTRTYEDDDGVETRWFEDGADMTIIQDIDGPDGIPDNPGSVTWMKPVRTDMKSNQSFNLGLSATLSIPLNRGMQKKCANAAQAQVDMQNQLIANKRLDFEIARLKNCGELKKAGIMFHPKSPYYSVCADIVVTNPGGTLMPHEHQLPKPTFSKTSSTPSQPGSSPVEQVTSPVSTKPSPSSQVSASPSQSPSSQQVSQPSGVSRQAALLGGPMSLPQRQFPQ